MKDMFRITMLASVVLVPVFAVAQPVLETEQIESLRKRIFRSVQPTQEQQAQLDQIFQTHRQALENWRREHTEALREAQKLQADALQTGDRDTYQAVGRELRELQASRQALVDTLLNQLSDVLEEKQFAQARRILQPPQTGAAVLQLLPKIQLAEMQNAEVQAILNQAAAKAKKQKNRAVRDEIMDAAVETIRRTVLTQPQQQALQTLLDRQKEQARRQAMLSKMEYTEQQKKRIQAILNEARKRAEKAKTSQEKQIILAEARKQIRRDVWTDAQREQFFLAQLEQHRRRMASVGMTPQQIAQAEKILTQAHDLAKQATRDEEKRQILREAFETIRRTVLRPDQRERLK